jgi:hypothetical protein
LSGIDLAWGLGLGWTDLGVVRLIVGVRFGGFRVGVGLGEFGVRCGGFIELVWGLKSLESLE